MHVPPLNKQLLDRHTRYKSSDCPTPDEVRVRLNDARAHCHRLLLSTINLHGDNLASDSKNTDNGQSNDKDLTNGREGEEQSFQAFLKVIENSLMSQDIPLRNLLAEVQEARVRVAKSRSFINHMPNETLGEIFLNAIRFPSYISLNGKMPTMLSITPSCSPTFATAGKQSPLPYQLCRHTLSSIQG
ncbi:hypothetical protein PIIN_11577 [Serendipita indica DSM 11827]|uniref:Uncharacterized protein n=1 Tax=Serendipita indica (strain DSM 11827) TaxID=1109443 RepID=G4U207_SERID|nr:hypothetical protein PIIN_11577 [Serendipita indica DSM 11827]